MKKYIIYTIMGTKKTEYQPGQPCVPYYCNQAVSFPKVHTGFINDANIYFSHKYRQIVQQKKQKRHWKRTTKNSKL